ncbi:MAG TPA: autotransporter outer membrane beta-barrel domain-containing protein, partial [Devosia sp.]|nr:autotransporter outer membrane beta-barrel domain-containing protein [Devosia sp.]
MKSDVVNGAAASGAKVARSRKALAVTTALAAGLLASPMFFDEARANEECGGVPNQATVYTVSCGEGPYSSIVYSSNNTDDAAAIIANFDNTQATGGTSGNTRSGVNLNTDEEGNYLDINIDQVGAGTTPSFSGGTATPGFLDFSSKTSNAFQAQTDDDDSPIYFDVNQEFDGSGNNGTGAVFTGGTATSLSNATANGISLITTDGNSDIYAHLSNVTVTGGTASATIAANANGFSAVTGDDNSDIEFSLDGGTITGGTANGASGDANGVLLSTGGEDSDITFDLIDGTITGGTSNTLLGTADGVRLLTDETGSDIDFESEEGTLIQAADGNGVSLIASGGGNVTAVLGGTATSTNNIAGVGTGVGLLGQASGGDGFVDLTVEETGVANGSDAGVMGSAAGTGGVTIDIYGEAHQTSSDAAALSLIPIPVGVGGVSTGSGNVEITTYAGSTVTQTGHIPGVGPVNDQEGAGVYGLTTGAGNAIVTADGDVEATGFGVAAVALGGGDATTNVGGDIAVNNTNGGDTLLGTLGFGQFGNGTVGALALSGTGSATVNLDGGNILGNTPDFGLMAVVLGGTEDATVNVGPNVDGAAEVNSSVVGVTGINLGAGNVVITETPYDDGLGNLTPNSIDSDGIGILGFATTGNVTIESGNVDSGTGGVMGLSGGVLGASTSGNVDITTEGYTTTLGAVGVAGVAGGNVDIALGENTVSAVNGMGVLAIAGGNVDINGAGSTVTSDDIGVLGVGENVEIDTNLVTSANSSGVIGVAYAGNADVTTHGKTTADNGLFGVAGFAYNGTSTVTVGGDIDPPSVGAASGAFGGDANLDVLDGVTVEADDLGLVALSVGGDADIGAAGATVTSDGAGVLGVAIEDGGLGGDVWIDTGVVTANGTGIGGTGVAGLAFGGSVDIDTMGDVTAGGTFGVLGASVDGNVLIDIGADTTVSAANGAGVSGIAINGNVDINAEGTTVESQNIGIGALALNGGVTIDSGDVHTTATGFGGSGVMGIALDTGSGSGDAVVVTHGKISVDNGLFGAAAIATGGNASLTIGGDIDPPDIGGAAIAIGGDATVAVLADISVEADDLGLLAFAIDGNVDIDADATSIITSGNAGVVGTAFNGDVDIDTGTVYANGTGVAGTGIAGVALGGGVDITTHNLTDADGLFGIFALADENVSVDITDQTVNALNGYGIVATAGGDVDVLGVGSTISSDETGIVATSLTGNATVDSGVITSTSGSGVIATAFGGDATITTHGKITADNGLYGASATSFGGNATVTVNEAIDPPLIGASAVTFGPGTATVTNNSDIEADLIGINATNFGDGDVVVTNNGTVGAGVNPAPVFGISVLNAGPGATTITNAADAEVYALGAAVFAAAFDPDPAAVNDISIVNDGLLQGDGDILATVMTLSDGSLSLVNGADGVITTDEIAPESGAAIWAYSDAGTIGITNAGSITGNVGLVANGVDAVTGVSVLVDNNATGKWTFSGVNAVYGFGDVQLDNAGAINAVSSSYSTFTSEEGDIAINNASTGAFKITGYDHDIEFVHPLGSSEFNNSGLVKVDGGLNFIGLDEFNNANRINMVDGDAGDYLTTTGNYNAVGSAASFAFNAELEANGASDYLVIKGDVSGTTHITVSDLAASAPGEYVDGSNAIVFAYVGGAVSSSTPDFTTDGGIDKGLFRYDSYLRDTPVNTDGYEEWVLASNLDREAFDLSTIGYGAQNLWNVTTGTWLDRTADLRNAFGEHAEGQAGNVTPGVWGRVLAANIERDMSNSVGAPTGLSGGGVYTYDDQISQDFFGLQMGVDFGSESVSASGKDRAWLFGLMGGWVQSDLKFDTSNTAITYDQWSVGTYATRLDGPFVADLLLKADFGTVDANMDDGFYAGSFTTHYTTLGATLDLGYKLALGSGGAFFEPKGTVSYGNTKFDNDLPTMLGTGVDIQDSETLRTRLGGRLGYTAKLDNGTVVEPYIEGNWWHEFEGDYVTNLVSNSSVLPVGYNVEGDQGEVLAGISVANGNNGWSFFLRGGTQFGEEGFAGYVGNLGVRKAFGKAATPPPPPPPPPPAPVCNKGPYIVFFDWDKSDITPEAATTLDSAVTAYGNCG